MEKLSCAIMGHNPQRFKFKFNEEAPLCKKIKAALQEQIEILYSQGVRLFFVCCSVGVDTWAAEIILDLQRQKEYAEIKLFCAIPFPEHAERFTSRQKKRYREILNNCTEKQTINNHYSPVAYKRCCYFAIDNAQNLITVYDQDKSVRNITGTTANYAMKKNLHIVYIHPDTATVRQYCNE